MSVPGTKLKFAWHHGLVGLPPHCRRSASNVGLPPDGRPDSEGAQMRIVDPTRTYDGIQALAFALPFGSPRNASTSPERRHRPHDPGLAQISEIRRSLERVLWRHSRPCAKIGFEQLSRQSKPTPANGRWNLTWGSATANGSEGGASV